MTPFFEHIPTNARAQCSLSCCTYSYPDPEVNRALVGSSLSITPCQSAQAFPASDILGPQHSLGTITGWLLSGPLPSYSRTAPPLPYLQIYSCRRKHDTRRCSVAEHVQPFSRSTVHSGPTAPVLVLFVA